MEVASPSPVRLAEASTFLALARKAEVEPNFWLSLEYLWLHADDLHFNTLKDSQGRTWAVVSEGQDDGTALALFPPVPTHPLPPLPPLPGAAPCFRAEPPTVPLLMPTWSDFRYPKMDARKGTGEMLDLEYLYDPSQFADLSGGRWATFRKNSRKWPNENPDHVYETARREDFEEMVEVLVKWLGHLVADQVIHDDSTLLRFMKFASNRKVLRCGGEIVGFNIWDVNYQYINFRYSICSPTPFLPEYLRLLFYRDPEIVKQNKTVNDGGVLDRPGLKFFKDKMNPVRIRQVCSWRPS